MKSFPGVMRAVGLAACLASLAACQSGRDLTQQELENSRFMNMWSTYTRCVGSSDLESTQQDSTLLRTISRMESGPKPLESRLPNWQSTSRLAVDLKAMSAACMLHAGDIAAISGRNDTAREMFTAILLEHSEPMYTYYAEQARVRLIKLETELQASLQQS